MNWIRPFHTRHSKSNADYLITTIIIAKKYQRRKIIYEYKITNQIFGGKLKGRGHVKNEYYKANITFTRTIYYTLRDKDK